MLSLIQKQRKNFPFNIRSVYFCKIVILYGLFFAYLSFFIHYFFTIKTDNFYRKDKLSPNQNVYIRRKTLKKAIKSKLKQGLSASLALIICAAMLSGCTAAKAKTSATYYAIDHDDLKELTTDEDAVAETADDNSEVSESKTSVSKSPTESTEESEATENSDESAESDESEESKSAEIDDDPEKEGTIFSSAYASLTITEKISLLKQFFPAGSYWNSHDAQDTENESKYQAAMHISTTPCSNFGSYSDYWCNAYNGITKNMFSYEGDNIQCLGFASMISDFLWGEETPIYISYDWDDIEVGDHIRFISAEHSVTVIAKTDTSIYVVECNRDYEDCMIEWNREITKSYLFSQNWEVLKRGVNPSGETYYYESDFTDRKAEHFEQIEDSFPDSEQPPKEEKKPD